jgi:PST family polysaccharide transporter
MESGRDLENPLIPERAKPWSLPGLVVKNAASLYAVQVGRKVIPLASIPYLARILGPAGWGQVVFVTAMAELLAIIIEFGFCLSATRSIAQNRDDSLARGKITSGVLCAQVMLASSAILISLLAAPFIPLLRERPLLLACGLIYAMAQGFSPLWFFQGMERIRLAAALEIAGKVAALGALFIFVNRPSDVGRAIVIQALSPSILTCIGIPLALLSSVPCRPQWAVVKSVLADGWKMFVFRSTESLYGVANAFLLGLFASPAVVGYFGAGEKISKASAGLVNPIRESLYPRINTLVHRNPPEAVRLAKIGTWLMLGIGVSLSVMICLFAGPVISVLMGDRFEPAVLVLRILSPLPILLAITFASGQLWLLPLGKDLAVLRVVFCAAVVNLSLSFMLGPKWGHVGMAVTVLTSESLVASSLLWKVWRSGPDLLIRNGMNMGQMPIVSELGTRYASQNE